MILLRMLLLPFSFIYLLLTNFRNHLFNIGYSRSFKFETKVINVGNLRVGGTGKSPHVEYLVRLLKDQFKIATLSRGYGRSTRGIILADETATAKSIGDEPMQFYAKFSKEITVAVGEERALAIPVILFERPETHVIIMDDAYQHRTVTPDLNILLTDFNNPFYKDTTLPAGRLRESRHGAKRADVIIVTKCPDSLGKNEKEVIVRNIKKYSASEAPIFFTGIKYQTPVPVFHDYKGQFQNRVLLVSGIADPSLLLSEVSKRYKLEKFINFNDHHNYSEKSIEKILKQFEEIAGNDKVILTTEKDMAKLSAGNFKKLLKDIPLFYLPIEIYFLEEKNKFDEIILSKIKF